jgi:hypothetical protein
MAQRKPRRDPYEVLGVGRDATEQELKRARRRKSREHHPDLGGSEAEQAEVNAAYDLLTNPARRMLYDQTGVDSTDTVDDEASALLEQVFTAGLNAKARDLLEYTRQQLDAHESKIKGERMKATDARRDLLARKDRYVVKGEAVNLIHRIIDRHVAETDRVLNMMERQLQVVAAARALLDEYESLEPKALPPSLETLYGMRGRWELYPTGTSYGFK